MYQFCTNIHISYKISLVVQSLTAKLDIHVYCIASTVCVTNLDTMVHKRVVVTFYNFLRRFDLHHTRGMSTIPSGASLIAELEYGTERWNGKWNGTVKVHSYN